MGKISIVLRYWNFSFLIWFICAAPKLGIFLNSLGDVGDFLKSDCNFKLSWVQYAFTSSGHLDLGCFSSSSLQILLISVRLDRKHQRTAIFRSFHRFSKRFKSRICWASQVHMETKPLYCCLGCVLWVSVTLEGDFLIVNNSHNHDQLPGPYQ